MSFADMKNSSMSFDELAEKLEESATGNNKSFQDDRFWYPKTDEQGNGYAVIRFLPKTEGDELPWVKTYSHGFREAGGWYIENCPTTIGNDCPVCTANSELVESYGGWDSTPETIKNSVVRKRKRKMQYASNVYIVSDPKNPENEGQVRLFKFGKKIFDKLMSASKPKFEDETPINPFDMWKGGNFKLKIRKVDKQTNYDDSGFDSVSQLLQSDDELEVVYNSQYKLSELIAPKEYKEVSELEKRYHKVIGKSATTKSESAGDYEVADQAASQSASATPIASDEGGGEEDDTLAYFAGLAEEE